MEQTQEIPVAWRDFAFIVLLALILHCMAWGLWWGVEGRQTLSTAAKPIAPVTAPQMEGPQYLAKGPVGTIQQ